MFKTIRVAAYAAAAAFLCTANSAAASQAASEISRANPAAQAAATAPATPLMIDAPIAAAEQAIIPAPAAIAAAPVDADTALTPGRVRPDRAGTVEAAPITARAPGVTAAAGERRDLDDLVAEHGAAPIADEQFECLASAVYFESRGEPLAGQLAVAEVILNRVKSGRFRATICDVVKQPSQFSFVRRGAIPEAPRHSAAWSRAVAIAHIALNDLHDVTGDNSLFFHATYVNPAWGRPARRIARIGNHIFYR